GRPRCSTRRSGTEMDVARHSQNTRNATLRLRHCTARRRTDFKSPIRSPRRHRRRLQPQQLRARSQSRIGAVGGRRPRSCREGGAEGCPNATGAVMKAPGPKRKGPHHWKGELAKPLLVSVALTNKDLERLATNENLINEDLDNRLQQAIRESHIEKLALLMEHYKIADKTDYFSLALASAVPHVPGCQVVRARKVLRLRHGEYGAVIGNKQGRQREWTPTRVDGLLSAVKTTKKKHGISSDREALERLVRNEEWRPPANRDPRQWLKTLRNQLAAARRRRPEN